MKVGRITQLTTGGAGPLKGVHVPGNLVVQQRLTPEREAAIRADERWNAIREIYLLVVENEGSDIAALIRAKYLEGTEPK